MRFRCGLIAGLLLVLAIAGTEAQDEKELGAGLANPFIQEMVDAVSRDSLASYISTLQAFGTRYEYTPQRDLAAEYILRTFNAFNVAAESDRYAWGTTTILDLAIVSRDSIWAVGSGSMIVATTDAGQTWKAQTSSVSGTTYYGVDFPNRFVGWAVGYAGEIIHTIDGGASWLQQTSGVTTPLEDVDFVNERLGIVVGSGGVVLRTTNGGTDWTPVDCGTKVRLSALKMLDSLHVWAVGDYGTIIHSTDGGTRWLTQVAGEPVTKRLEDVDFVSSDVGWAVGGGTFRFANETMDGVQSRRTMPLHVGSSGLFESFSLQDSVRGCGVTNVAEVYKIALKTTDGGQSWKMMSPLVGPSGYFVSISLQDSLRGCGVTNIGEVYRTTDGGESWSMLTDHLNVGRGLTLYTIKATSRGEILCGGSRGTLTASWNDGATWTSLTPNLPSRYIQQSRNIVATIVGRNTPEKECIIVAHYDSYSSNPGAAPGANDNASGTSAVMEAVRLCLAYGFSSTVKFLAVSAEELGMYGSTSYALRARNRGSKIIGVINGDMLGYPVSGDTARLVIGSYVSRNRLIDSALAYNSRYGIGLTLIDAVDNTMASDYGPFAKAGYDALEVSEGTPNEIWAGADPYYHKPNDTIDKLNLGMVRRGAQLMLATVAELAVPEVRVASSPLSSPIPEQLVLHQNYPNPFNPSTTIRYGLPNRSHVTLTIFTTLGQQVALLQNGEQDAGVHEVRFEGSGLSSGVYLYRMQSGDFVQTRKLLLVR